MNQNVNLSVSRDEAILILNALAELPFKAVAGVINNVSMQIQVFDNKQASAVEDDPVALS